MQSTYELLVKKSIIVVLMVRSGLLISSYCLTVRDWYLTRRLLSNPDPSAILLTACDKNGGRVWVRDYTTYVVCKEHIHNWLLFILAYFYIYSCTVILASFFDLDINSLSKFLY